MKVKSNWLDYLTPKPKTRNFIMGSVGSGKSTLGCQLVEHYRLLHPRHILYVIDPKGRYVAIDDEESGLVFPDGVTAVNHGRIDGVTVNARLIRDPYGFRFKGERTFLVQGVEKTFELFDWLFHNADVRIPTLLFNDESFDFMRGVRADPSFRRIVQLGRELGIGHVTINQRPSWIDATLLSESERLYVGSLNYAGDRKKVAEIAAIEDARRLLSPLRRRHFLMVDQTQGIAQEFTLKAA